MAETIVTGPRGGLWIARICPTCGQEFTVWKGRADQQRFCSHACKVGARHLPELPPTELAYMAGLFDGEGHVSIRFNERALQSGSVRPYYSVEVNVHNTYADVLHWMKDRLTIGWVSCTHVVTVEGRRRRPLWAWHAKALSAALFLDAVMPYLQIKRERAELAVQFRREYVSGHGLSDAAIERAEVLRLRMRGLNGLLGRIPLRTPTFERLPMAGSTPSPKSIRAARTGLTREQAQAIRERYAARGVTYERLAVEYGVSEGTIAGIVRGELGWSR